MFKINPNPTFTADVPLSVPGQADPVIVKVTFKHKSKPALLDFEERIRDKKTKIEELLFEIVEDWSGIDAPCTQETITTLAANYIAAPVEIITAYNKELVRSKIKN